MKKKHPEGVQQASDWRGLCHPFRVRFGGSLFLGRCPRLTYYSPSGCQSKIVEIGSFRCRFGCAVSIRNLQSAIGNPLRQLPRYPVFAADELIRFRRVLGFHVCRVPLQLFARAVCDVTQMVGFGEPARVLEVARGGFAGLAGVNPLGVMSERLRDKRFRLDEIFELVLGQQHVFLIIK